MYWIWFEQRDSRKNQKLQKIVEDFQKSLGRNVEPMEQTITFPDQNSLIKFEDAISELGLLHDYSSNYNKCTFQKKYFINIEVETAMRFNGTITPNN